MDLLPWAREPSLLDKLWMTISYPVNLVKNPARALVSIPALSFLVIPAFSSYSTSINLLFFYMTWAILIRSNPPLKVELLGTLGVRILFYILPSLGFLAFDSAASTVAVGIKEHGDRALATGEALGGKRGRWWKVALVSLGNTILGIALQIGIEFLFTRLLHIRSVLKVSTSIPFPWSIAKDLFLGFLLREIFTYVLHRYALHSTKSPFSKMHNSWQHNVPAPFSLIAHYDHPVPYIVHVFLPTYLPAVLLRFHLLTYHIYLAFVSLEETFAYSGYNVLPSAFILGGIARRQEKHLMGGGDGNYGCFGLADFFMGTSLGTDIVNDVVDEAEEKQVGQKTQGKVKAVSKKAREKKSKDDEDDEKDTQSEAEREEHRDRSRKGSQRRKDSTDEEAEETRNGRKADEKPKRKARHIRNGKPRSEDEAKRKRAERGPNDEAEEGESSTVKGKGLTRKSSQRKGSTGRPRKRSEEVK